jgi:hypothetical protein
VGNFIKLLLAVILTFFVIFILILILIPPVDRKDEKSVTENFIETWLRNENGTIATYIKDDDAFDEDLVKGREALSETLGLWMVYALEKDDQRLFKDTFQLLQKYFLEEDGFVNWKLDESGESKVSTNALVDDLRIIDALFQANEKWPGESYEKTAILMSAYVNRFNINRGILTDFYERLDKYSSDTLTLSYIKPAAMEKMRIHNLLDEQTFEKTGTILKHAPLKNGFYPKSYDSEKQTYLFDKKINMVDQALVAYHQTQIGAVSAELLEFIKKEIEEHGVVYGRYDRQTKEPVVEYESPAVYGILIMYCLEIGEKSLASTIYERMILFRNTNLQDPYNGGYSVKKGNTHIFDNLIPLIAEQRYIRSFSD